MSPRRRPTLAAAVFRSALVFGVIVGLFVVAAVGWLGSDRVRSAFLQPGIDEPRPQARVTATSERTIALDAVSPQARFLTREGVWAVENNDAFGLLGPVQDRAVSGVLRRLDLLGGASFEEGSLVAIHPWAYGPDPTLGLNLAYDELDLQTNRGPLGGWVIDGSSSAWAIVLRDSTDQRRASLRLASELHGLGLSVLALDYRNQGTSPSDPSGLYQFGATEWADVERAVDYVTDLGARDVYVFGSGMGGSIAVSFALKSTSAGAVNGIVLEGPHLDLRSSVAADLAVSELPLVGLPTPQLMQRVAVAVTGWRFAVDWSELDYVAAAPDLRTPVLIVHGRLDGEAPLAPSVTFAAAAPEVVQLEIFEDTGHDEAWNVDQSRYRSVIAEFVAEHAR